MSREFRSRSRVATLLLLIVFASLSARNTFAQQIDAARFIVEGMETPVIRVIEGCIRRIDKEPQSYRRYYELAATLDAHELLAEATTYYQKALTLKPDHLQSLYNCGLTYEFLGRPEDAKKMWDQIISKDPQHPQTNFRIGEFYFRKGALDEALACFQIFIASQPDSAIGHSRIGRILLQLDRPAESLVELEKVLEMSPLDRPTLVTISQALLRAGNREKAQEIQQQLKDDDFLSDSLILLDPLRTEVAIRAVNSTSCIARAENHEKKGEYASALMEYELAATGQPNNARIADRVGKVHVALGNSASAIDDFDRAIALDPTFVDAYHNRGVARQIAGMRAEAVADFRKVLELEPGHPFATEQLQKLGEL